MSFLQLMYSFVTGIFFVLFIEFLVLYWWFSKSKESTKQHSALRLDHRGFESTKIPERLMTGLVEGDGSAETCAWFNSILSFLFDEWRDNITAKQVVMSKLKKEFDELLSKALGKVVKDLTVRQLKLGTSLPLVHQMQIVGKKLTPNGCNLQELDVLMDMEYKDGDFQLAIDADVLFQKSAFVVISVCHFKGPVQLKFTKEPFTHWSFSLMPEPDIHLKVTAEVEGRSVPQIANLIENQLHKTILKKHTFPNRKARFKPFLPPQVPKSLSTDVIYNGSRLSEGEMEAEIIRVEKLPQPPCFYQVYCTMSLDLCDHMPFCDIPLFKWKSNDIKSEFSDQPEELLGVVFCDVYVVLKDECFRVPAVYQITDKHLASSYRISKNDVLDSINGIKMTSRKDVVDVSSNVSSLHFKFLQPPSSAIILPRQTPEVSARKSERTGQNFQTKSKPLSRNISWGQSSSFVVGEDEDAMFLNVCVWGVMKDDRRDVMMGKASLKLTEIALKCAMTSSSVHNEKFFLVPSDALQNLINSKKLQDCSGEILGRVSSDVRLPLELKPFNFFPGYVKMEFHYDLCQDEVSASSDGSDDENSEGDFVEAVSSRPTPAVVPHTKHRFEPIRSNKDIRMCSICQKKFKSANLQQCKLCGLLCDAKCAKYSVQQVKCSSSSDPILSQDDEEPVLLTPIPEVDLTGSEVLTTKTVLTRLKEDLAGIEEDDALGRKYLESEIISYTQHLEELDKKMRESQWQGNHSI